MEGVGNTLGHFIKFDKETMHSLDKRMEKVLVEVDIHTRLLETLEIEWRVHLFYQRLDYLGIPFHYSLCICTSHLRKECPPIYGALVEENSSEICHIIALHQWWMLKSRGITLV
jgi:hypothetical protein